MREFIMDVLPLLISGGQPEFEVGDLSHQVQLVSLQIRLTQQLLKINKITICSIQAQR